MKGVPKYSLVFGKLTAKERNQCVAFGRKYQLDSPGLMEDIFHLVKTRGLRLKTRAACNRLIRQFRSKGIDITDALAERYRFLHTIKSIPLFAKLCEIADTYSVEEAVDRLLTLIKAAYRKQSEGICQTCALHQSCEYGQFVTGTRSSMGKVHDDCPIHTQGQQGVVPKGGAQGAMTLGAMFIAAMLNPAFVGVTKASGQLVKALVADASYSHDTPYFDTSFTGDHMMKELERIVDALTAKDLVVFNLARTFDSAIEKNKQGKVKSSFTPSSQIEPEKMRSMADITRLTPTGMALPKLLQAYKLGTKQHMIVSHRQPQTKKQLMYVLVDSSQSMTAKVAPNRYAFITKGDVATALTLAVIKKVLEEKSMMYYRFFAGAPDILHKAKTVEDFTHLSRQIALCNYNGGSTRIDSALKAAFEDIQTGKDEILKAEVLLISDAEDDLSKEETSLRTGKKGTKLNTLEILNVGAAGGSAQNALKKLSDTYVEIDATTVDFERISKVVPN